MRTFLIIGIVLLITLGAGVVGFYAYQQHAEALKLILLGDQYYKEGKYHESLIAYKQAHEIKSSQEAEERIRLAQETLNRAESSNDTEKSTPPESVEEPQPRTTPSITHLSSFADPRDGLRELVEHLVGLLRQKEYGPAHDILMELAEKREMTNDGKDILCILYDWLTDHCEFTEDMANALCAQFPNSSVAFTVKGRFYINSAWQARGDNWGYTVSEEEGKSFKTRLYAAKETLLHAHSLNPSDPTPSIFLLTVCKGLGLPYDEMEAYFQQAVILESENFDAYMEKLMYLMPKWRGSYEEMFEFAFESARSAPKHSAIPLVLAYAYWEAAERSENKGEFLSNPDVWKGIEAIYTQFLQEFPRSTTERAYYAVYASYANREALARTLFDEALAVSRKNERVYYERGRFFKRQQKYRQAVEELTHALTLFPDFEAALAQRGVCYYRQQKYGKALTDLLKALEMNPKKDFSHAYVGFIYNRKQQYHTAIPYFTTALQLDPRYARVYSERAYAYLQIAQYREAIRDYTAYLELNPKSKDAYHNRAWAYKQLGDMKNYARDKEMEQKL